MYIQIEKVHDSSKETFEWWSTLLTQHIQKTSVDKCHMLRALACEFISHIPSDIFTALPVSFNINLL